jgi:hydroxymethylpyrimidine/phosphomethylpyrimidine kinase
VVLDTSPVNSMAGKRKDVSLLAARQKQKMPPCVLTIAGSDSGAGAGIQADLKTLAALDVYGLTALTAVTAQNSRAVERAEVLPAALVGAQVDAVLQDFPVDVIKTGMLGNAAIVEAVAAKIKRYGITKTVVDPVMVAKSGDHLLEEAALRALQEKLLPLALVITPNIPEAEVLCGWPIGDEKARREAAYFLHRQGPAFVLLKGGHFQEEAAEITDVLFDGEKFFYYRAPRIITGNTHGTGCTFAAAIAAQLARGKAVPLAVKAARDYLQMIMPHGLQLGRGHGPLNHFYGCRTGRQAQENGPLWW